MPGEDIIERPSFTEVIAAVDNIRKRAILKIDDLIAAPEELAGYSSATDATLEKKVRSIK